MPIPDNWFAENSPADIVAKVAEVTLAEISKWDTRELLRVGWFNPVIEILYSMTSAGVWVARTDTSGQPKVVEANSASVNSSVTRTYNNLLHYPDRARTIAVGIAATSTSIYQQECKLINETLAAGGVLASTQQIAAQGSGFCVFVEEFNIEFHPVTADISALGGNGIIAQLDDSTTGTVLSNLTRTHASPTGSPNRNQGKGGDNEAVDLTITAPGAGNVGACPVSGYILWRKVPV